MTENEYKPNETSLENITETFDAKGRMKTQKKGSNMLAKVLSVLAAFLLWLYVFQAVEVEKQFKDIPIRMENFNSDLGLDIASGFRTSLDITVKGTNSVINGITAKDIKASVDMSGINNIGSYTFTVNVDVPGNVTVVSSSADTVTFIVDKTVEAEIPVEPSVTFNIQYPYQLGETQWTPASVMVKGPEADVKSIVKAVFELHLGNVKNNVSSSGVLKLIDRNGYEVTSNYLVVSPETVNVSIPVYKTVSVPVAPQTTYDEQLYDVTVTPQNVCVKGSVSEAETLSGIRTVPFTVTGAGTFDVALEVPEGMTAYGEFRANAKEVTDVTVTVTAREQPVLPEGTDNAA